MARARIAIRTDADALIGGGHVMRCLTLADALAVGGAKVDFVSAAVPDNLARRIEAAGHRLLRIGEPAGLRRSSADWHEPPLSDAAQREDAAHTRAAVGGGVDWLIVDHYLLSATWEASVRSVADKVLVIDDLANRAHDCDLLLDQTLGRTAADYRQLVPESADVLAGAHYALLRPEFAQERPASLERRRAPGSPRRILLSLGTMDIGGVTARAVEAAIATAPDCHLDVVIGSAAQSADRLRELVSNHPRLSLHVDTADMARLMRDADVALGAAGTSSWERCCLGLPSLLLVLAGNQRPSAQALDEAGAARLVTSAHEIGPSLAELVSDTKCLQAMSAAAFAVCDGEGAARLVAAIAGSGTQARIALRRATGDDSELLWLWRNDPVMRAMAKTAAPITWEEHARWFQRVIDDPQTELYIAELAGSSAAMVRFDRQDNRALVSINVSPAHRGKGIGSVALAAACEDYCRRNAQQDLVAEIRHSNDPSKGAFRSAGFVESSSDSEFVTWSRPARDGERSSTE